MNYTMALIDIRVGLKTGVRRCFALVAALCLPQTVGSETLFGALAKAYQDNPDLNQQRAAVRVRDEDVPKAATGMRPRASVSVNAPGAQSTRVHSVSGIDPQTGARTFRNQAYFGQPRGAVFSVSQPLFDAFKTKNSVGQAESGVLAARAALRFAEQDVLLKGVTSHMDVLRDTAVLRLRKNNIDVLKEQLRETRVRYKEGDVTFTDLAQAEAGPAQAHSDFYLAEANLKVSSAQFNAVIGSRCGLTSDGRRRAWGQGRRGRADAFRVAQQAGQPAI